MIDFEKYNIKIRYLTMLPAGLYPLEIGGSPFIVRHDTWWRFKNDEELPVTEIDWESRMKSIEDWCEKHRNETLIVHLLTPREIRYSVITHFTKKI